MLIGLLWGASCFAQSFAIPPVKTALNLEGQPVGISVWGSISSEHPDHPHLSVTADLAELQQKLTPILAAQLNRSDRCGERLNVENAALLPAGLLTASVHFERFGCMKAFGKEVVRRLVGGNAVIKVSLTPSIAGNHVAVAAEVRDIEADGSLGEALHSGSFGDSIREKIKNSVESSIQKAVSLKSALPPAAESAVNLQRAQFVDGGEGKLWLTVEGELRLSTAELQPLLKQPR